MSFERINAIADPVTPAKIRFYYETDRIFNSVSLRTTYRANMIKDSAGESQLDDVAISAQERDIVLEFMAEAIFELAAAIFKLTDGIDSSVLVDSAIQVSVDGVITDSGDFVTAAVEPGSPVTGTVYQVTVAWGDFAINDLVTYIDEEWVKLNIDASCYSIKDNAAFNSNVLPSLDKKMESCIKYFIMREWYGSVGLDKDMAIASAQYTKNFLRFKNLTFQLRKPLMT